MKYQLPLEFDAERLHLDLAKVREDEWITHYNTSDHEGPWHLAALISPGGMQENIWSCAIPEICRPTPLLERCQYLQDVLSQIQVEMSSVRLMRLGAGALIKEHSDSLTDDDARIHVPITTNPEVEFYLNEEIVKMDAGSCWFLDFREPHSVVNRGSGSRTHLVIDGRKNDWFFEQIGDE